MAINLLKIMRPVQWSKNLLVFVPLIAAHEYSRPDLVIQACLAFLVFSISASSIYIFNDLLDREQDRRHPRKKLRPLASGEIQTVPALALGSFLFILSAIICFFWMPTGFFMVVGIYMFLAVSYSLWFKRYPILDVLILTAFYNLRILSGASATGIPVSYWLMAFALFLFSSLAFFKRFSEFSQDPDQSLEHRGYLPVDRIPLGVMGIASGYLSILVLALYIHSPKIKTIYSDPQLIWVIPVLFLFWISRLWLRAFRGEVGDDPLQVSLLDPASWLVLAVSSLLVWIAV